MYHLWYNDLSIGGGIIKKDNLEDIFSLRFIKGSSLRSIASELGIHRITVTKYVSIMKENIDKLSENLISEGIVDEANSYDFIITKWKDYSKIIIFYDDTREKRKLTPSVIKEIEKLTVKLETTSAIKIYSYIKDNHCHNAIGKLSYSSIWRAIKSIEKRNKN